MQKRSCIDIWIYIANCINLYIEDEQTKSEQNEKSDSDIVYIIFKYLYKIIDAKSKIKRPKPYTYNTMC